MFIRNEFFNSYYFKVLLTIANKEMLKVQKYEKSEL